MEKLTVEELKQSMSCVVKFVAGGLMTQRLADDILQPIFTALSLYDKNEKIKEGIEKVRERLESEIKLTERGIAFYECCDSKQLQIEELKCKKHYLTLFKNDLAAITEVKK